MYQQLEVILRSPPSQPQPQPRLNNDHFQVLWVLEQIFGQSKNLTLQTHARFQVFLPHACRLGFALHIPTFLQSVALPQGHPSRPHPCLLDMISLWALRLSQSPDFIAHEPRYLSNALSTMPSALGSTNALHRIQFVQAEVLLALYFFCDGRLLEGRYHAAAAMTAAVSCRFHQIGDQPTDLRGTATIVISGNDLQMPPPRSAIELGERISIFWSAFILDRCWSVALGCPPSLLDDSPPASGITTPLQMKMEEYESVRCLVISFYWVMTDGPISSTRALYISDDNPAHPWDRKISILLPSRPSRLFHCGPGDVCTSRTDCRSSII